MKKNNKVRVLASPNIKAYYIISVIKTAPLLAEDRHRYQWDRIEDSEIDPHKYAQLIFDKDAKKKNQWKKDSLVNK